MLSHPVSVIIPTYNRNDFLREALNSVFRQSARCAEIIVVDDGSTDGTEEFISGLKAESPTPIHYLKQKNKGPAAARNSGISLSSQEYITFLDSDDHWRKRKIQYQLGAMQKQPDYLISHTREKWYRKGEHLNQKKKHIPRHGDIFSHCLELCAVGMSTVMVRRDLFDEIGLFDESLPCCEDYDFWLRASCRYPFLLVDEPLTIKEGGRDDQVSHQYRVGMDKLRIESLEKLLQANVLTPEQATMTRKELVKKATIYGNGCMRHDRVQEGQEYLALARSIELNIELPETRP
ncbi:glycosyltransferase family 2 protein [Desulfosediminicola sp.]|uniref:glycosyltransferase family 2 protein n=1 Tax=Desulfosediminicola sp. TaxID=2886825 RepID=UPI003AF23ACC